MNTLHEAGPERERRARAKFRELFGRLPTTRTTQDRSCSQTDIPYQTVDGEGVQGGRQPEMTKTMDIFSFGLENMNNQLAQECAHLRNFEQPEIEVLRRAFQSCQVGDIDVFVDARPFPDPEAGDLRGHVGNHPQIIARMAEHKNFRFWLSHVHREIRLVLQRERTVRIGLFCKKGRHRSVAAAWLLKHIGEREGWTCTVTHLCSDKWNYRCREWCRECREGSPRGKEIRIMALDKAWGFWKCFRCMDIFSFGLENMDNQLSFEYRHLGKSEAPRFEVLEVALQRQKVEDIDVVVDARPLADSVPGDLSGHVGNHPETIAGMAEHRNFRVWLRQVHRRIRQVLQRKWRVRIGVFCEKGDHRSVAAAWLLKHIGEREGWMCTVTHLCSHKWTDTCGGRCDQCGEDSLGEARRQMALDKAWYFWQRF